MGRDGKRREGRGMERKGKGRKVLSPRCEILVGLVLSSICFTGTDSCLEQDVVSSFKEFYLEPRKEDHRQCGERHHNVFRNVY